MRKKPENMTQPELVSAAIKQLGTAKATAAAVGCSRFALRLWLRGQRTMLPAYRKLLIDILTRPGHYAKYKVLSRPARRPTVEEAEAYRDAVRKAGV